MDINKFYIGKDVYTLRFDPRPAREYNRISNDPDWHDKGIFMDIKGKKRKISKKQFINIMKAFGKLMQWKALPKKKMIK